MIKTKDGLLLNLSASLRHEVKNAAKEADMTETAFIREAIKSRLRNLRIPLKSNGDSASNRTVIPV